MNHARAFSATSPPGNLPQLRAGAWCGCYIIPEKGTALFADDSSAWNELHAHYEMKRINHQLAYSDDDACTNGAESFFSRMRRAEIGHHHHIAGVYLARYAQESAWREDHRRMDNGAQVRSVVALALAARPSVDFYSYWQRAVH